MKADAADTDRKTLDGVIYEELRGRIVSLVYPPGTMIFENAVAAEYSVSRTPVRQAFFRLSQEELLQVLPQRGARVSRLSVDKFKEAQAVRQSLELTAIGQVARDWKAGKAPYRGAETAIRGLIRKQEKAIAARDFTGFIALDEAYHDQFMILAGNRTLLAVVQQMRAHLDRIRFLELTEAQHESEAVRFHQDIFDAIRQNDVPRAQETMRLHLMALEAFREGLFRRHKDLFR
jgi:DNA-binding GntR family transcriptional regulator